MMLRIPIGCHISAWTAGGQNGPGDGGGNPPLLLLEVSTVAENNVFTSIAISGGTATLGFKGDATASYQLQKAPSASGTYVNEGSPQVTDGAGNTSFTDANAGAGSGATFRTEQQ
jgi:hypothetical protein